MSSRRQASSSNSRHDPMESLVYALVPALAPQDATTSNSLGRSSASGSRPSSRLSRADSRSSGLNGTLRSVPEDDREENERNQGVKQLTAWMREALNSSDAQSFVDPLLVEQARRRVLESKDPMGSSRDTGPERALRFGGIWTKLQHGKALQSPLPHVQFLLALSSLEPKQTSSGQPGSFPWAQSAGNSRTALADIPVSENIAQTSTAAGISQLTSGQAGLNGDDRKGKGKSKADILNSWRASQARPAFSEQLLLRDILYLLQGIDGQFIRFAVRPPEEQNPYKSAKAKAAEGAAFALGKDGEAGTKSEDGEVVGIDINVDEAANGNISKPTRLLLMQIAEMGMLYRQITNYLAVKQTGGSSRGMIEQSLCHFLHHELSDYHRLLAVLETQMNLNLQEASTGPSSDDTNENGRGLTLLRMGLWTEEMKLKMRYLAAVVSDAKAARGGALVSKIHQETNHGDPFVRNLMSRILVEVSKPFFGTLQKWIFSGELHDPFQEFFVQLNPEIASDARLSTYQSADVGFEGGLNTGNGMDEAHKVWEKKYVFVKSMIPGFINDDFAKKIFSTGRSLNFIRYSCGDTEWIETQAQLANAGRTLTYTDLAGLERSIDDAYTIANARLLDVFFDKYSLLDHLRALKSYLMLGMGDFAELLMEALAPRLSKPAISLYRHHLTSDLESAIRGSNAQYDSPDILRRLDARVLEYSHGEIGWDCFALEYKVEAPLNAVLDAKAMLDYDKVFHHLWRLMRVEVALTQGWMRVVSGERLFEHIDSVRNDWHHCRIVQGEMVHFLRQLQAFSQLEVIECSWQTLVTFTDKRKGDLEGLIQAHRAYLDRVVKKILLLSSKRDKEDILFGLVKDALQAILRFKEATDDLYAWSLAEATRLDRLRDDERGLYSAPSTDDDQNVSLEKLRALRDRIRSYSISFQDKVVSICHLAASHSDLDIRFLAIRLAFNGHYELRKSKKAAGVKSAQR